MQRASGIGPQHPQAPDQHGQLRRAQGEQLGPVQQQVLAGHAVANWLVVAEAIGLGLQQGERFDIGLLLGGIAAPRCEGHLHPMAASSGGRFDRRATSQHDQVGQGHPLGTGLGTIKGLAEPLEHRQHPPQLGGIIHLPAVLGRQAQPGAVGTAALVGAAERGGGGPGRGDQLRHREARGQNLHLERSHIGGIDQGVIDGRNRVLPEQIFAGHLGTEIAQLGAQVAVGELEPGAGEGLGEGLLVVVKAAGDRCVDRIEAERKIGRGHDRPLHFVGVVGIGDQMLRLDIFGDPLPGPGRTFAEFPVVAKQHREVTPVPGGGVGFPGPFQAAGGGIGPAAAAVAVVPAQALLLDRGPLRRRAHQAGAAGTVGLAEGVPAGGERHGFLVVHGHAGEGLPHVAAGGHRIGHAIGAFRVHVDQPHLHSSQGLFQLAIAAIAPIAEPGGFVTPVDVCFRLPDVNAASAEAEGGEAHRLEGNITGQDDQISPGNAVAVGLLDRP